MKLPRDLSGAEVVRRLAPSLRLPRDSEPRQPHDRDADGGRRPASGDRTSAYRDVRIGTLDAIIVDVAAFLGLPKQAVRETLFG